MALATPAVVTINAVAQNMPRINQDDYGSHFRKIASGYQYDLKVRHQTESAKAGAVKTDRHNVDLIYTTYDAYGVVTGIYQSYVVLRTPQGADPTIIENMSAGLLAYVTANDGPIIGWEN